MEFGHFFSFEASALGDELGHLLRVGTDISSYRSLVGADEAAELRNIVRMRNKLVHGGSGSGDMADALRTLDTTVRRTIVALVQRLVLAGGLPTR